MIVRELILALQQLPEEVQDSPVFFEDREFGGPLDVEGTPFERDFCSIRVETWGKGKRRRHEVLLY